jgi:mannose-6-phosphate isomerase
MMPPVRLASSLYEKVWGVPVSDGPHKGLKLGEIWFTSSPLLLKFLFTSEKLSVQVHPDDSYAARHEQARGGRGKTELWYIVDAQPGARLAIGFQPGVLSKRNREQLRQAALDGSMEQQLNWIEVHPGDAVFVPAGTVHALGPGLTLCEIQQHCDVTYRLFDYGRPRELHVEKALDVIRDLPHAGRVPLPFSCEYFQVREARPGAVPPGLLMVISGRGKLAGRRVEPREVWRLSEPAELVEQESLQCLLVNP